MEYIWAPIGSRPRAVRDNRHDSVYLFDALCADRAVGAAIIMPAANTEAMNEHLTEISVQVAPGAHAVLVCDGAGWHQRGGELKVPDNITLLTQPAYSPEVNCMENVWDYLRGNGLSHLVWNSYEDIVEACAMAWRFLIDDPDRIRSIAHRHWAYGQRISALILHLNKPFDNPSYFRCRFMNARRPGGTLSFSRGGFAATSASIVIPSAAT